MTVTIPQDLSNFPVVGLDSLAADDTFVVDYGGIAAFKVTHGPELPAILGPDGQPKIPVVRLSNGECVYLNHDSMVSRVPYRADPE